MTRFIFDVDGTLTDARQRIDPEFADFMADFCMSNKVALVTGSDREKTVEQLGETLLGLVDYSFNCAGNEVWYHGNLVQRNEWQIPSEIPFFFEKLLEESKFRPPSGEHRKHLEIRTGMVNFSIAGRDCSQEDRKAYIQWDNSTSERARFREKIANKFPDVDVLIGGDTGLDIFPMGKGKEQVIDFLKAIEDDKIYYFGDQIIPGGNDCKIAMRCDNSYRVRNWRDTYETLAFLKEAAFCE